MISLLQNIGFEVVNFMSQDTLISGTTLGYGVAATLGLVAIHRAVSYFSSDAFLLAACHEPNPDSSLFKVKLALMAGANINCRNQEGQTPLHIASGKKSSILAEYLLKNEAAVEVADHNGETPLFYATHNATITALLLQHGAEIHIRNEKKQSIFETALDSKERKGAEYVYEKKKYELFNLCIEFGDVNLFKLLLGKYSSKSPFSKGDMIAMVRFAREQKQFAILLALAKHLGVDLTPKKECLFG